MSKINVKKIINPIEKTAKEHRTIVFKENETVYECLTRDGINVDDYTILVNGYIVKNPENVFLSNLDSITLVPVLGGGKRTGFLIAMTAVAVSAYFAGPALAVATLGEGAKGLAFLGAIYSAGITTVGGIILNNAFDLQPDLPGGAKNSASYNWSEKNPSQEGLVVPIVFGKTKITPPIVSSSVDVSKDSTVYWGHDDIDEIEGWGIDPYKFRYQIDGKDNDLNSLTMRLLLADHDLKFIDNVTIDGYDLEHYENVFDLYGKYYNESGLNTDTLFKYKITIGFESEDKSYDILDSLYDSFLSRYDFDDLLLDGSNDDYATCKKIDQRVDLFSQYLGRILARTDTKEVFVLRKKASSNSWGHPSHEFFPFYWHKVTDQQLVDQIFSIPCQKDYMNIYQGYDEVTPTASSYKIIRSGSSYILKGTRYEQHSDHRSIYTYFWDDGPEYPLPRLIDWGKILPYSHDLDLLSSEEVLNKGSHRKYEMCFDTGQGLLWSLPHQNEIPDYVFDGYKRGGHAHKAFHNEKSFRGFRKLATVNGIEEVTNPSDITKYIVKKDDYSLLDSTVFDKNVIQQELHRGTKDEDGEETVNEPEFLYVSPKKESDIKYAARKKSVYVSLNFPAGLYKIREKKEPYKVNIRFEVKKKSSESWKLWDTVIVRGNVHGSTTVFVGPFNSDYSKKEIYQNFLGGPEDNFSEVRITTEPPALPSLNNISSLPSINEKNDENEEMQIRIKFEEQPSLNSDNASQVIVDTVYSFYDYDMQTFPGSSFMDLRLGASHASHRNIPKVEMIVEAPDWQAEKADGSIINCQSNLPPWQVLKLLTDPDFGEGIPMEDILTDTFEEWEEFCHEKHIYSNYVIDSQGSFDDVVAPIYNLGRAYPIQIGTKHGVAIDKKADSVSQVFNEENIVADSFSVEYLPEDEKANIFAIKFRDEKINYEQRTVEYRIRGIEIDKERRVDLTLNNCTDFKTAKAHAAYMARSNYYCNKIVKFTSHLDSIACQVGDVINVNYRGISWGDHHSRILEKLSGDRYRVSGEYEFQEGKQYFAIIRSNSDDKVHEMKVYNGSTEDTPAETTDIILENGFYFSNESIVTIGERVKENKYRVTSITRHDDFHRDITAVEYNDKVYDEDLDFDDDIIQEDELDGEPRYLSVKEIHIEGKKASLIASWSGSKSKTLLKVYHKGELIFSQPVNGNQSYIPVPDTVKINDSLKITIQKEGSNSLLPDQIVDRIYKGVPDHVGENIYSVNANFSSDKVVLDIKPDLPEYVDYCSVFMHYDDLNTGRKIEFISGKVDSFPYIINQAILPGKYKFEITPYKNNEIVIDPIISKIFKVGSNETDHTYTPKVTGLRLANNTASWNTRDLEIVWKPITAYYEAGAGSAEAGAGVTESKKSILYNVVIKNSNFKVIHDTTTTKASFKYLYEQNVEDNDGTPEPELIVLVTAVNEETGENSPVPAVLYVTHEIPTIDEFNKKAFLGGVFFKWSVLNPDLIKEYKYKTIVTESETAPVWSELEWMSMIGDVYSKTFPDKDEEGKYVHFLLKAVNIYNQESLIVTSFKQPECFKVEPKDIEDFALNASKMYLKIPVLENEEWSGNSSNIVSWNAHQLYYYGKKFNISAGSTSHKYIYFKLPSDVDLNDKFTTEYSCSYNTSNSHPGDVGSLGQHDFIIVVNVNGHAEVAWNAIANQVIGSAYIMDGAINNAHISSLSADKISLGPEKYWAIEAGANNTQNSLNLGAELKNCRANGSIFMEGGLINSDIIQVNDKMVVGKISQAKLDDGLETKTGAQEKASQAYENSRSYTQNWCSYGADNTIDQLVNNAIKSAKVDGKTLIDGGFISSDVLTADHIQSGTLSSKDNAFYIDLDENVIQLKPDHSLIYFSNNNPAEGDLHRIEGRTHPWGDSISTAADELYFKTPANTFHMRLNGRMEFNCNPLNPRLYSTYGVYLTKNTGSKKHHLFPQVNSLLDVGTSTNLCGKIYSYEYFDETGQFQDSLDDLEILHNIKPKKGVVHEQSGLELIDNKSLPRFMTNYDSLKAEVKDELGDMIDIDNDFDDLIQDDDQLGYRLKRNVSAFNDHTNGAVRQLDREVTDLVEQLNILIEDIYSKLK